MRKFCLYLWVLSCLILGCSSNKGSNHTDAGEVPVVNDSEVTLYYDTPKTVKLDLKEGGTELNVQGNNCVDILTDPLKTDSHGMVTLEIKARLFNCEGGKKIKVCIEDDNESCAEFTVRTTSNDDEIDANHNLMIDLYETNKDKDKFANYQSGDCSSFCHDDGDCEDFCDSAIGYRCSMRCTSDDQCIKYKDDDGNWIQMKCREDGRCAYPTFLAVYDIEQDGATVTMGGHPAEENVTIDWGDGSEKETVPMTTEDDLSHTYSKKGRYYVEISGDYRNWTAGCSVKKGIDLYDVLQFGPLGLGYVGNMSDVDQGTFSNCQDFNKMSARDIPDSTKLTNMNSMFAGNERIDNAWSHTMFDDPAVTRWDTSNVTSMYQTFYNSGVYHWTLNTGFRQDIGRWDTSKVKTMHGMFNSNFVFNVNIGCWNTSNVEDISFMFVETILFNQNLSSWDLGKVTEHNCVFRYENGHNGNISLKNYCALRSRVNNENIGRDGDNRDPKGDCPGYYNKFKKNQDDPYYSTCCGTQGAADIDRSKYEILCDPGYDYYYACDNDRWKKVVNDCLEKYLKHQDRFKHLTEDTVTCNHLRTCMFSYYECQLCAEGDTRCLADREQYCPHGGVYHAYDSSVETTPVCYPCQHLDPSQVGSY